MNSIEKYIVEFKKNIFMPKISNETELPDEKGLYLICIAEMSNLPKVLNGLEYKYINDRPVLYLGISGNRGLRKRDYKNQFTGTARNSTLRKSLGTILGYGKEQYANDIGTNKYKFTILDEQKLSNWMKENLILHYCVTDEEVESIETELIKYFNPPLNLSKNRNEVNKEFRKRLRGMRCEV